MNTTIRPAYLGAITHSYGCGGTDGEGLTLVISDNPLPRGTLRELGTPPTTEVQTITVPKPEPWPDWKANPTWTRSQYLKKVAKMHKLNNESAAHRAELETTNRLIEEQARKAANDLYHEQTLNPKGLNLAAVQSGGYVIALGIWEDDDEEDPVRLRARTVIIEHGCRCSGGGYYDDHDDEKPLTHIWHIEHEGEHYLLNRKKEDVELDVIDKVKLACEKAKYVKAQKEEEQQRNWEARERYWNFTDKEVNKLNYEKYETWKRIVYGSTRISGRAPTRRPLVRDLLGESSDAQCAFDEECEKEGLCHITYQDSKPKNEKRRRNWI